MPSVCAMPPMGLAAGAAAVGAVAVGFAACWSWAQAPILMATKLATSAIRAERELAIPLSMQIVIDCLRQVFIRAWSATPVRQILAQNFSARGAAQASASAGTTRFPSSRMVSAGCS